MSKLIERLNNLVEKGTITQGSADYLQELFTEYPENIWFAPTNADGKDTFSRCINLAEFNLMAQKFVPRASGKGTAVYFMYCHNQEFSNH
jgi:hypothetical protein